MNLGVECMFRSGKVHAPLNGIIMFDISRLIDNQGFTPVYCSLSYYPLPLAYYLLAGANDLLPASY